MRKRICIISFSPIRRDARVLRQIEYLSPHYDLTVIGYGEPGTPWPGVDWRPVEVRSSLATRVTGMLLLAAGRAFPRLYDTWYWQKLHHRRALEFAVQSPSDAYLANDWNALPVAAEAARRFGAKLVLDAHEYAPLEFENKLAWRVFYKPLVTRFLGKHVRSLSASMTVSPLIAKRYEAEFGFSPTVVLNAPALIEVPDHVIDPEQIRLVYHGGASPDRKLEKMIKALALSDKRYSLTFILVETESAYVRSLKALAEQLAPERIRFLPAVAPADIVPTIASHDIGFYMLEPSNYNNRVALPNKFFDFLAAGLAVGVGPSTGMAQLAKEYGFGAVAPSFEPREVARTLDSLSAEAITDMREAARAAALRFNAGAEMRKLVDLFRSLFGDGG